MRGSGRGMLMGAWRIGGIDGGSMRGIGIGGGAPPPRGSPRCAQAGAATRIATERAMPAHTLFWKRTSRADSLLMSPSFTPHLKAYLLDAAFLATAPTPLGWQVIA